MSKLATKQLEKLLADRLDAAAQGLRRVLNGRDAVQTE